MSMLNRSLALAKHLDVCRGLKSMLARYPLCKFNVNGTPLAAFVCKIKRGTRGNLFGVFVRDNFVKAATCLVTTILLVGRARKGRFCFPVVNFVCVVLLLSAVRIAFAACFATVVVVLLLDSGGGGHGGCCCCRGNEGGRYS